MAATSTVLSTAVFAALLSYFLRERMIRQEAELTQSFVQHAVSTLHGERYFESDVDPDVGDAAALRQMFAELATMPGVLRTNVYDAERRVIWSSDPAVRRRAHAANPELEQALAGRLIVESGHVMARSADKPEHAGLGQPGDQYVESYIPIRSTDSARVVGAFEIYKVPRELFSAIHDGSRLVWLLSVASAGLLFVALIGLVRHAQRTIEAQRVRLVESEAWAVTGEMALAVAHGVRNPVATIRSSAELLLGMHDAEVDERARDVIDTADRLDGWVRQLLNATRPIDVASGCADLSRVLADTLRPFEHDLQRKRIACDLDCEHALPSVRADTALLEMLVSNVISNAIDAMAEGGRLLIQARRADAHRVSLSVRDTGVGMSAQALAQAKKPFHTTKPRGLGLGLPLSRRLIERLGGRFTIDSAPGAGTTVSLELPICS